MRRTAADPAVDAIVDNAVPAARLCQQCGACAAVCPSQRHGGIRPAELMARAVLGSPSPDGGAELWLCARCMSCSERCPSGADPGEAIARLREDAAARGSVPRFLVDEAERFRATALCFPRTGMTKKMRRELGLPDGEVSENALKECAEIVRRTGLGRVGRE
ncbi:MAG: 4Fe-4S dicluster domain-containing protein [Methanomassiliicoccus sp.]|nr:4Fe-4S dicluster domain-containing protein [Methanomassiliicoccus sp.]